MPIAALAADRRHVDGKIRETAAIQHVIGGECLILPDARSTPIRVCILKGCRLMPALKLLIAIVCQPDRTAGEEHRRQRDIEREWRMIASAESAADIGELGVDPRRLEWARALRRGDTRPILRPRRATARRGRARGFLLPASNQASPDSGSRNIGSTDWVSNSRSSTRRAGLFAASSARIARHRPPLWHKARPAATGEHPPDRPSVVLKAPD